MIGIGFDDLQPMACGISLDDFSLVLRRVLLEFRSTEVLGGHLTVAELTNSWFVGNLGVCRA